MTIVVAGHICVDLTPSLTAVPSNAAGTLTPVGPMDVRLGGSVANSARAFGFLGVEFSAAARVGSDALGELALQLLANEGLHTRGIEIDRRSTTSFSVVIEPPGRDRSFWHNTGANDHFTGEDLDLSAAKALHVGYPSLLGALRRDAGRGMSSLFRRAVAANVMTSLDLAVVDADSEAGSFDWGAFFESVLPYTDVISPSVDDLRSIASSVDGSWATASADHLANSLIELGASIALVSAGSDGVHLAAGNARRLAQRERVSSGWANAVEYRPAVPVASIESTNGAGDATSAGLLTAILRGGTPEEATAAATEAGAAAVRGQIRPPRRRKSER